MTVANSNQTIKQKPDQEINGSLDPARLRPDVEKLVDQLVFRAYGKARQEKLRAYHDAKRAISRCCGWDSPAFRRDDEMYNLAVARFVRGVQL